MGVQVRKLLNAIFEVVIFLINKGLVRKKGSFVLTVRNKITSFLCVSRRKGKTIIKWTVWSKRIDLDSFTSTDSENETGVEKFELGHCIIVELSQSGEKKTAKNGHYYQL